MIGVTEKQILPKFIRSFIHIDLVLKRESLFHVTVCVMILLFSSVY